MSSNVDTFENMSLREVAELHCAPFSMRRRLWVRPLPWDRNSHQADSDKNNGGQILEPLSISDEEIQTYIENAKLCVEIKSESLKQIDDVVYPRMCVDEFQVETLISAKIRHLVFDAGWSLVEPLPTLKTIKKKLAAYRVNYADFKPKPWAEEKKELDQLAKAPKSVNRQKMIESIYKPLKAFPDDFASDDPCVWQAVENLRCALPWRCATKEIDKLIKASRLVKNAIDLHVNTKHAATALESFEAGRQEQNKKKRKVTTDEQEEKE